MKVKFLLWALGTTPIHETEMESPPHVGDLVSIDSKPLATKRQVRLVSWKLHDPMVGEDLVSPKYLCVEVVLA